MSLYDVDKNIRRLIYNYILRESVPKIVLGEANISTNKDEVCIEYYNFQCELCKNYSERDDEIIINNKDILASHVTSYCCQSIVCPNCYTFKDGNVIFRYLFITDVLYLDEDEDDPTENGANQESWLLSKPFDKSRLKDYKLVDAYNKHDVFHFRDQEVFIGDIWPVDIRCLCECKYCGFKCSAGNYMAS